MRIVHWTQALVAVLGFAAVLSPVYSTEYSNTSLEHAKAKHSPHHKRQHHYEGWHSYEHHTPLGSPAGKFLSVRQNQMLLRKESVNGSGVDCCPSVMEMIEPEGGKNLDDQFVELYRDGDYRQRFYEWSCHGDVLDKPCRFMDKHLHERSRCVQKYSYTYALVKDSGRHHHHRPKSFPALTHSGTEWTLDYVRVRSGCGCVVVPPAPKKKRDKLTNRHKMKHRDEPPNR